MKISATEKTKEVVRLLQEKHGELIFEQSSGCCDGTVPMCFEKKGHYISSQLVQVGEIESVPYYVEKQQLDYLKYMHQTIDCIEGQGASFSLESSLGFAFIIHSEILK